MENRPAPLRSRRICRFCLTESEPLNFIYERDHSKPFKIPLTLQIMSCVGIEVYAADGMPQTICNTCYWNLDRSYKFKLQCHKADEALRDYPSSDVLPRPFGPIPNDPPDTNHKRSLEQRSHNEVVKKPRLDVSDRERLHIRDREHERSKDREREKDHEKNRDRERDHERNKDHDRERERNREKQVEKQRANKDSQDLSEEEQDVGNDDDQDTNSVKEDDKLEPGEIRVHACDQCGRTFPLRQALILHIQRAHRDRNYKCTECDHMFFSKYDLTKHMTTHSEEKPYSCPICNKQFSRANLLQRHEKVHRDELRYGCEHCNREFFTIEELENHEDSIHKKEKPFQCNICNKRFTYKQGLERHEVLHSEDKTFVCEYCKETFRTSTKLARHLTTHAGHRPYLCKLCPRSFLLSHHLTRHMRTHSVEKRHVCEDCGKAFKRKESLEVHQLTHTKRTGMGLRCDVCQETCRNRADYVTHIKQHIEAGEKMGPDGLQPDSKPNLDLETDEDEEEEQYSDGDDDYEPPAHVFKTLPKPNKPPESEDESERSEMHENQKGQVVYVRHKDGNVIKKRIKTLMPIQRKEIQDLKVKPNPNSSQTNTKQSQSKQNEDSRSLLMDDVDAQVQKIVASVFKESRMPYMPQHIQEQIKESSTGTNQLKGHFTQNNLQNQDALKEDKSETATSGTPKTVNTVKVIKRIFVKKPSETSTNATTIKETDAGSMSSAVTPGYKVTKKVIVCKIMRQGDTAKEVIMNPDGTIIDPADLAKLPAGNVVRRVVVKKPLDKSQGLLQTALQTSADIPISINTVKNNDSLLNESPKFELKTSQATCTTSFTNKTAATAIEKPAIVVRDQKTKEKLEQLEKRVEQQRLKIEELEARKQQEYETLGEMSPERHNESDDEQQLPLRRVFVKKKQSMYDEEQEYSDSDVGMAPATTVIATPTMVLSDGSEEFREYKEVKTEISVDNSPQDVSISKKSIVPLTTAAATTAIPSLTRNKKEGKPTISSSKVYANKKIIVVKPNETSEVEEMSRELCSILDSTDSVVKMQETVLCNLTQISSLGEPSQKNYTEQLKVEFIDLEEDTKKQLVKTETQSQEINVKFEDAAVASGISNSSITEKMTYTEEKSIEQPTQNASVSLNEQDLSESADIFEPSDNVLEIRKCQLHDSVMELNHETTIIDLNDTTDSQDSLEDKLQQMEG